MNSRLKIKYGQIEFEIESDPATIEKEREIFLNTLPKIASMSNTNVIEKDSVVEIEEGTIGTKETKQLSYNTNNIVTFIKEKGFDSDIEKTLAVAYFMQTYENAEFIDTNTIRERMRKAKISVPKSISVAINNIVKKGYFCPTGDNANQYYVTEEGSNFVDNYVKKEKTKSSQVRKIVSKGIESKYSFLNKEIMCLDEYPNVPDLKSNKDKIMLTMYIIKDKNQGEFFTVNDLIFIMSRIFNEKVTKDIVSGLFKNSATKMYFDKKYVEGSSKIMEFKLLASGERYVKEELINKEV